VSWRASASWAALRDGARVRVRWAKRDALKGRLPFSQTSAGPAVVLVAERTEEHAWRYGTVRADAPAPPRNIPGMEGVKAKPAHRAKPALVCLLDGGGALNLRAYNLTDFEVEETP
jgi:hypothetical protein